MSKPHIRIHYTTPKDGCVNGQCFGNSFGCHHLTHKEDDEGVSRGPVCANYEQEDQPATWFELISGNINDLKKEEE